MSPITEQEMHEAALSSILNALTRGQPGPDGRPSPKAVGEAQAIAHWLETAPDGALADVHDEDGSDGAEAPKKPVRPVIQPETTGGPLPLADEDDPAGGDEVVYAEDMLSLLYEARHAPGPEGIDIAGKHYTPGEFIPAEAVAQATPAQKRKLTRAAKQAGGDGATAGGQPPQPRKAKSPKAPAKLKAPTVEEAHALIEEAGIQPDREKLAGLANSLSLMTVKDLHEVKKRLGLRAGGRKSELAAKISKLATARITEKEHFAREARKVGVRPQDLHRQMQERMHLHNMHAKQLREVVVQAYRRYPAFADGFRLTRSMRGFRNRDWNAVPGFDTLARSLAGSYPEVLGAHGYDADRGYDANENEAAEKLFELIEAGPAPLLSRREAYEGALDDLQRYRGTRRSRDHEEEFTLYARQEAETSSLSPEQAQAFVEAIRDASSPEELRELAELIQEMADADSPVPDDPAPITRKPPPGSAPGWTARPAATRRRTRTAAPSTPGPTPRWAVSSSAAAASAVVCSSRRRCWTRLRPPRSRNWPSGRTRWQRRARPGCRGKPWPSGTPDCSTRCTPATADRRPPWRRWRTRNWRVVAGM